jgi:HAE1 family hydrophobic/amphiphilic exporter-1
VKSFTSTAGAGSAFTGDSSSGSIFGNITVELREERSLESSEVVKDLRNALTDVKNVDVRVIEQENGPPGGAPLAIKFFGDDLGELGKVADRAQGILESIPGTTDIVASTKNLGTEFVFRVDSAKASALGLSSRDIAGTLRTAVYGSAATTIRASGDDVDVVVKLALDQNFTDPTETTNVSIDALKNISVTTRTGTVLLGSVLEDTIEPSNTSITHENGRRVESVTGYTTPDITPAEVVAQFQTRESELLLSEDMTISYAGETEDVNRSFTEMFFALIAGLVLMLAILVLAFNSLRYSLYLLSTVPLSLIGVFAGLAIMREPLSFTSLLGVVALAGVIINHAIILMDSLLVYLRERADEPLLDTVVFASATRLRPIFLTTITTVLGMIPLSRISDFWSPLAYAIMYGLTFAMVLTLVLVPTLFYRAEKRKRDGTHGAISTCFRFVGRALLKAPSYFRSR